RIVELRVIERVEHLEAEFDAVTLRVLKILAEHQIPIVGYISPQEIVTGIAEGEGTHFECVPVEFRSVDAVPAQIDPIDVNDIRSTLVVERGITSTASNLGREQDRKG